MRIVIRITGQAGLNGKVEETLRRLNIHRKFACTLIDEKNEITMGMLHKVRDFVAFNEISDEMAKKLIIARGEKDGKPVSEKDASKVLEDIKKGKWTIKPFFRLHPPRGGFKKSSKLAYPRGILGENKDLDKLLVRML